MDAVFQKFRQLGVAGLTRRFLLNAVQMLEPGDGMSFSPMAGHASRRRFPIGAGMAMDAGVQRFRDVCMTAPAGINFLLLRNLGGFLYRMHVLAMTGYAGRLHCPTGADSPMGVAVH